MNSKHIFLYALFLLTTNFIFCQDVEKEFKPHRFKLGINKLISSQFLIGYEYKIHPKFSVKTEVGFLKKAYYLETIDNSYEPQSIRVEGQKFGQFITYRSPLKLGYSINTGFRFYTKENCKGLIFGVITGYQHANFGNDLKVTYHESLFGSDVYRKEIKAIQNRYLLAGELGFTIFKNSSYFLETNMTLGVHQLELKDKEVVPNPSPGGFYGQFFYENHHKKVRQAFVEFNIILCFDL